MAAKKLARGLATRTANKLKRRDHILACAGTMIALDGLDALTLANLAKRADVTVPTIHNLLGKRTDILVTLVTESMEKVMEAGQDPDLSNPITAVTSFIDSLIALYETNEPLYKAAFLAGERLKFFEHRSAAGIFARSVNEAKAVCREAINVGQLEGRIEPDQLAVRLFASQRLARQDWMNGYIDLKTYRTQVVTGMLITLCSDAAPAFKTQLINKINSLKS